MNSPIYPPNRPKMPEVGEVWKLEKTGVENRVTNVNAKTQSVTLVRGQWVTVEDLRSFHKFYKRVSPAPK